MWQMVTIFYRTTRRSLRSPAASTTSRSTSICTCPQEKAKMPTVTSKRPTPRSTWNADISIKFVIINFITNCFIIQIWYFMLIQYLFMLVVAYRRFYFWLHFMFLHANSLCFRHHLTTCTFCRLYRNGCVLSLWKRSAHFSTAGCLFITSVRFKTFFKVFLSVCTIMNVFLYTNSTHNVVE